MRLTSLTDQYVAWRRLHGAVFEKEARILKNFCAGFDSAIHCDEVARTDVCRFLAETDSRIHPRKERYRTLAGFYRYAISRKHVIQSPLPLPEAEPETPAPRRPHIYSHAELVRLFETIHESRKKAFRLDGMTFRTLLLLLYSTGLRVGEAIRLTVADVNLDEAVVTVRQTKFNKSRLVPLGDQICGVMRAYAGQRMVLGCAESRFLSNLNGTPLQYPTVKGAFAKLRAEAQIQSTDEGFMNPTLHSFRHTFATNRVTAWYQQGADVQRLLPALSTCLGHASVENTRVYLSMTPELLHEASLRFNDWINGDGNE